MKYLIVFYSVLFGFGLCLAGSGPSDLTSELSRTGENGGGKAALEKWHRLPPDQQLLAIEAVVQGIRTIGDDTRPVKFDSTVYVTSAAWLLAQVGTDEQIVSAFGNLSEFGNLESDAARALASCKSSDGVKIIEKLAEKRLPELESAFNLKNDEKRARSNDILVSFYFLILRLDGATNPEGSLAAKRLRDQVAARYLSEKGKSFVATLDDEMLKARSHTKMEKSKLESLPSKNNSNSAQYRSHEEADTSVSSDQSSSHISASKWFWPVVFGALILLVITCWSLISKISPR